MQPSHRAARRSDPCGLKCVFDNDRQAVKSSQGATADQHLISRPSFLSRLLLVELQKRCNTGVVLLDSIVHMIDEVGTRDNATPDGMQGFLVGTVMSAVQTQNSILRNTGLDDFFLSVSISNQNFVSISLPVKLNYFLYPGLTKIQANDNISLLRLLRHGKPVTDIEEE